MRISIIIQFATILAEFIFFLKLTIYGMYILEMALNDGIVAVYPYYSHLPGF